MIELPPLPEPESTDRGYIGDEFGGIPCFGQDQMRSYGEACARAALEAAVNACVALELELWSVYKKEHKPDAEGQSDGATLCAEAIRALATSTRP